MKKNSTRTFISKTFAIACVCIMGLVSLQAQNQVYWKEGFDPNATSGSTIPTTIPTVPITGAYYVSNAPGSWYIYGAYRTTGSSTNNCSSVIPTITTNHIRFSNAVATPDSSYIITPIVDNGIQEFHFFKTRASRYYTVWSTNDTLATTTNWNIVTWLTTSTVICEDTKVDVNSATAKRIKLVCRPGTDSDIDSVWLTSFSAIIPVEMVSFTGKNLGKTNELTWKTVAELNNKGYQIDRGGGTEEGWQKIGFVKGKGQHGTYTFVDESPNLTASGQLGTSYYRLRQIDYDGKETVSKVISISNNPNVKLKVYPSVTTGYLMLETEMTDAFEVFNLVGQVVLKGKAAQRIDVTSLPHGSYMLKVGNEQAKFIKQ